MGKKLFSVHMGLMAVLLVAACNPQAASPETPTLPPPTAQPSVPTATSPIEPSETPTLVPTEQETPTLAPTPAVTPTPTAQLVMVLIGARLNVAGVDLSLNYALKQDKYELTDQNFQRQIYQPDSPDDLLLVVEATVDSEQFEQISQWVDLGEVFVVDENGRKDLPSGTFAGNVGGFPNTILWMFSVSGTSIMFTLNLPDNHRIDLSFLQSGEGDLSQYNFSPATGEPTSEPVEPAANLPPEPFAFECPALRLDDFTSSEFGVFNPNFAKSELVSGELRLTMKEPDSWVWTTDGEQEVDALYTVDVQQGAPGSGAYGIVFGANKVENPDLLYVFMISPGGYYGLFEVDADGEWAEIREFKFSGLLSPKGGRTQISVARSGPLIAMFANGIPLRSAIFEEMSTGPHYAGLIALSNETPGLQARFDNYSVCFLTEPYPMPVFPSSETLAWPAGYPAVLEWVWMATSRELAQEFIAAADMTVQLNELIYPGVNDYWSEPIPIPGGFAVEWKFQLPPLEKGLNRIELSVNLYREITDGYDSNQDGKQDLYGPGELSHRWVELEIR